MDYHQNTIFQLSGTAGTPFSSNPPPAAQLTVAPTYPQARADGKTGPKTKRKYTHKCPWQRCMRTFSCPHNVQQHIREAHTNERPYACEVCSRAFNRPYTLYRHMELQHGIKQAGPGRGRSGGLPRIGVGVSRERKGRRNVMGDQQVKIMGPSQPDGAPGAGVHQAPPPETANPDPAAKFEVNNFTPMPTACRCGAGFDNREALLGHLHDVHGDPNSRFCNCMFCSALFGDGRDVDAAGVHDREVGAVTLRGLMAGDVFGDVALAFDARQTPLAAYARGEMG